MKPEFSFDSFGKTGKVAKYALIGLTVGVLGAGILSLFNGGLFTDPVTIVGSPFSEKQSVAAQNVKNILISTGSADVQLKPGTGDEVLVELRGNGDLEEIKKRYTFTVEQQGDTAKIEFKQKDSGFSFRFGFFQWNNSQNLEVTVPQKWYDSIKVDVASGDVEVQDFQTNDLSLAAQSGDLHLHNIETKKAGISVASGDVNVNGLKGESLNAEAQSGDLNLGNISGAVNARTSSGQINLKMAELTRDVSIQVASGDVNLSAPKSASFAYEIGVASGDINIDFADTTFNSDNEHHTMGKIGSGGPTIQIETSSGDIQLRSY